MPSSGPAYCCSRLITVRTILIPRVLSNLQMMAVIQFNQRLAMQPTRFVPDPVNDDQARFCTMSIQGLLVQTSGRLIYPDHAFSLRSGMWRLPSKSHNNIILVISGAHDCRTALVIRLLEASDNMLIQIFDGNDSTIFTGREMLQSQILPCTNDDVKYRSFESPYV